MQSFLPVLAAAPTPDQSPFLTSQGHARRRAQAEIQEQSRLAALERSRKRTISQDPILTDEQLKFRKVVQHERQHYNLKTGLSPPKKRPPQLPSPPPSAGPKSILKNREAKTLVAESPLAGVEIARTASAKLNYLLKRIVELSGEEKIIVFSDYAPMMWYLGEALEILGIEHLIYIQRLVPSLSPRAKKKTTPNSKLDLG